MTTNICVDIFFTANSEWIEEFEVKVGDIKDLCCHLYYI